MYWLEEGGEGDVVIGATDVLEGGRRQVNGKEDEIVDVKVGQRQVGWIEGGEGNDTLDCEGNGREM